MKDGVCITFANVSKLTTDGCGVTLPCDFWMVLILPNSFVENYLRIAQEKLIHLDAHFRWECNPLNNEWSIKLFSSQLYVLYNHVRILHAVHSIKTIAKLSWMFQSSYTTESNTSKHKLDVWLVRRHEVDDNAVFQYICTEIYTSKTFHSCCS